ARARGGQLDGGLVGHHLDDGLVELDLVALFDLPPDDLALDDTFADIRHVEVERHGYHSKVCRIAFTTRSALGKYSCSRLYGNGVSRPVTRRIGASRCAIARSWIEAISSAPKPQVRGASWTMTARPVFFTLASSVWMSNGASVRRSMTSTEMPACSASRAASSAIDTMPLHAISVTCEPSRVTAAWPSSSVYSPSGTSPLLAR